jgi:hypothetical protein
MNHEEAIPAAAAPTATTVPAAPERGGRRRLKVWLVLLLLAASGVAAYFLLRETRTSTEFRLKVEEVFKRLDAGEAEKVYEEASFRFKQTLLVDKFVDMVDQMHQTFGTFVGVVDVIDVDRASTVAGMTARVELELEFEKDGRVTSTFGEMSFHRDKKGQWKLLGMSVQIPKELEHAADVAERDYKRLKAPDEVIEQFNQILDAVREGKAAAIHQRASPSFQEQRSVEQFQHLLDSHRSEMGNFVRVLAVISSAQNANKDRARVHALLQYEKAKTTGTFEFMRVGPDWRLYGFKVVVPEPFVPADPSLLPEVPFTPEPSQPSAPAPP